MMNGANVIPFGQEFRLKHLGFKNVDAESFHRLQWTNNRTAYIVYRSFMMIYALGWFLCDVITTTDPIYYAYISHWTEFLQVVYFVSSFFSALFYRSRRSELHLSSTNSRYNAAAPRTVPAHLRAMWILFNVAGASSIGVSILYWSGRIYHLIGTTSPIMSVTIHVHATCCLLTIIELMVTDVPIRLMHFYQIVAFSITYLAFTALLHATGVVSAIYPVLNWDSKPAIAALCAVCGSFGVAPLLHLLFMYGLYRFRRFLAGTRYTTPNGKHQNESIYNNQAARTLPGV